MARRKNPDFDSLSRELQCELERMWLRSKEEAYEQVADAGAGYTSELERTDSAHPPRMIQRKVHLRNMINYAHETIHRPLKDIDEREVGLAVSAIEDRKKREREAARKTAKQREEDYRSGKIVNIDTARKDRII